MQITRGMVSQIAHLARLALTPEEEEDYLTGMRGILDYFDGLNAVSTDGVAPTSQAVRSSNVTRPDAVERSYSMEELMSNAPRHAKGYIVTEQIHDVDGQG